jgi:hypothetical protein
MVSVFDEALNKLRGEKLALEADVKAAEIHLLVMWKEYMLLVDFSKKDDILAAKLADKHLEHKVRSFKLTYDGLCCCSGCLLPQC